MIYIDGIYYKKEEAKIPVYDHGLLYGDGVFEGIRIYNGKIFKLREHVKRIFESAKGIYLDIGISQDDMANILLAAKEKNKKYNGYIRLIVTRGDGPLGIDPYECKKARIIVIVDDISLYPEAYYTNGIKLVTSTYRRIGAEFFDVRIKSLNYLNNVLAKMEAKRQNCQESVMLNSNGHVAECTGDNIFIIKDGILKTPSGYNSALEGITRQMTIEIGQKLNLNPQQTILTRLDLYNADEMFLTGTGAEIIPVIEIDGLKVGNGKPGKLTIEIMSYFKSCYENIS